jgi:uncharacterized protein (TIGR03663 family)
LEKQVSTGSTKSSARSGSRSRYGEINTAPVKISGTDWPTGASAPEMETGTWRLAGFFILLLAALVRLYALELKPLHHDEGVNGFFLLNLVNHGVYKYDPANYHGPTLYYFALLVSKFFKLFGFGLSTTAVRLAPVLFGVGTVWLILCLRRRIGAMGALAGAALFALSPGAVYMSRYFIHESLFVFFTLAIVVAVLRYTESANPLYLLLASASAALLFATKETAMISAGVLLIGIALAALYVRPRKETVAGMKVESRKPQSHRAQKRSTTTELAGEPLARFGGHAGVAAWTLAALLFFVFVYVLFYSSFFKNMKGVSDSLKTFKIWAKTGTKDHVHEWYTYLSWLCQEEGALLVLGSFGALLALGRARSRFLVFTALWAAGIIAAYSLIPYKTPWLTLNLILPLAIIAGYGVDAMYRRIGDDLQGRILVLALFLVGLVISGYQLVQLNFRHYDDDAYIYPYAHTVREILPLVEEINRLAEKAGTGKQTTINFASPDYWPLPWYLRDYKRVGYGGRIAAAGEALVIGSETQAAELDALLGENYRRVGDYPLRPGVTLVLYARRDLP